MPSIAILQTITHESQQKTIVSYLQNMISFSQLLIFSSVRDYGGLAPYQTLVTYLHICQ